MRKKLKQIPFGQIADFRNGLNFGRDSHGTGCVMIGVPAFKDRFTPDYDSLHEINPEGISKAEDYLQKGDIVFVRSNGNKALVGRTLYLNKDVVALFSGFCIRARILSSDFDSLFCAYFTRTSTFKSQMLSFAGTNISNLSQDILGEIRFPHFGYIEQQKLAAVLASLDAKIECNNRINNEIEALTKTLYDYWFVQFDFPNTHGKPYKSSGGRMEYNTVLKRKIPIGWAETSLGEITLVSNESITPSEYPNKEFKHFSIPVFDATHRYGEEPGLSIGSNKFTVRGSDLLVSKLNPWFNRVVYVLDEEDQICSTEFVVWRSSNEYLKNYLYQIATSQPFIAFCTQSATGTSNSHKRINPEVMMSHHVPYHPEVANEFGKKIASFVYKTIANRRENYALAQLREWLLPMLMNGQVTVA